MLIGGEEKPTHLQHLIPASQEHLRRPAYCVPCIPSRKNRLFERGVHRVLHAPNVVADTVWRELFSYNTHMWPGAGAQAQGRGLSRRGGRRVRRVLAMVVVAFLELSRGGHVRVFEGETPKTAR